MSNQQFTIDDISFIIDVSNLSIDEKQQVWRAHWNSSVTPGQPISEHDFTDDNFFQVWKTTQFRGGISRSGKNTYPNSSHKVFKPGFINRREYSGLEIPDEIVIAGQRYVRAS